MYKCEECGNVFEKPVTWVEEHGEEWCGSPCCKEDYIEVKECDCGEYIEVDEKFCNKCKSDLKQQFSRLLHENFDEEEIEMLNELFDGEYFN